MVASQDVAQGLSPPARRHRHRPIEGRAICERDGIAYPHPWRPDDAPPVWWDRKVGKRARSIAWSFAAGEAERHNGWYFLYDPETERLWCWHWNHQWSSHQVSE